MPLLVTQPTVTEHWRVYNQIYTDHGNVADERVILFSHCEINFAGVRNAEVRPAISTDPNPNHNRKLSLLEMAENNITPKLQYCPDHLALKCSLNAIQVILDTVFHSAVCLVLNKMNSMFIIVYNVCESADHIIIS